MVKIAMRRLLYSLSVVFVASSIAVAEASGDPINSTETTLWVIDASVADGVERGLDLSGDDWFEILLVEQLVAIDDYVIVERNGYRVPADGHGFGIRLVWGDGPHSGRQPGDGMPLIRSVGANGRDDRGTGDDWDYGVGPNWGYWYKRGYPLAVASAVASLVVGLSCFLWPSRIARGVGLLVTASGAWLAVRLAFPNVFMGGSGRLENLLGHLSSLLVVSSVLYLAIRTVVGRVRVRSRRAADHCAVCGYPVRVPEATRCSECGAECEGRVMT